MNDPPPNHAAATATATPPPLPVARVFATISEGHRDMKWMVEYKLTAHSS